MAEELLGDIHNAYVIADSAYSAKALVDSLVARGCTAVIPANPTHAQRDYEKLARNFLAFLFLASSLVWLA